MNKNNTTYQQQFSDRFNQALDANNIPPKHQGRIQYVADLFNLTHRGAGKWVNGQSVPPKAKRIFIAKTLKISSEWLEYGHGDMKPESSNIVPLRLKQIPVLTFSSFHQKSADTLINTGKTTNVEFPVSEQAFLLAIRDNSMAGRFPIGTHLIVDPKVAPQDGDYVLVQLNKTQQILFRQFVVKNNINYLFAHNPDFPPEIMSDADQLLGKVMQARMNLGYSN